MRSAALRHSTRRLHGRSTGLASFCLDYAVRNQEIDRASKLRYVRDGISLEDRALALDGTFSYASANKVTLLRMQARLTDDPVERAGSPPMPRRCTVG